MQRKLLSTSGRRIQWGYLFYIYLQDVEFKLKHTDRVYTKTGEKFNVLFTYTTSIFE